MTRKLVLCVAGGLLMGLAFVTGAHACQRENRSDLTCHAVDGDELHLKTCKCDTSTYGVFGCTTFPPDYYDDDEMKAGCNPKECKSLGSCDLAATCPWCPES
jgi:hypothetical protein